MYSSGRRGRTAVLFMVSLLILTGCATKVVLRVQRTPNWNTAGIGRIAIMPFEHNGSGLHREAAEYLTTIAATKLRETNHFTLVDSSEITRRQRRNESIIDQVDALLAGQVLICDVKNGSYIGQRYDPQTKQNVNVTYYEREVQMSFTYSLRLARDGSIIGVETRDARASDSNMNPDSLKSQSQLVRDIVNQSGFANLTRNLVPYVVTERHAIMKETSKNKILQGKMKEALGWLKEKNYRIALNKYLDVYSEYSNFAAAYNAAILHEALGEVQAAASFMQRVAEETGNPRARDVIVRLNRIIADQALFDSEYSHVYRQIDRVIAYASGEILKVLPRNAKVWVLNNEKTEKNTASSVADNISSTLIKNGITVVDRENTGIIEMEQQFQMSGYVSDSDFVSIGNAAGANILVVITVPGTGATRRLQLRVVDIERRIPLLQSDTGENWNL